MKKFVVLYLILLSLSLTSCNSVSKNNENQTVFENEEKTEKVVNNEVNTGDLEDESNSENDESADSYQATREKWVQIALEEEALRRVMPELQGIEEIIEYVANTGGKAYQGTYEGKVYYMYLDVDYDTYGNFFPIVTVIQKKEEILNPKKFGGRGNTNNVDEDEEFFEISNSYEYIYDDSNFYNGKGGGRIKTNVVKGDQGEIEFINSNELIYRFSKEVYDEEKDRIRLDEQEMRFTFMQPDEAKYWYSQNALNGEWDDFMYYEAEWGEVAHFTRVEFTNGINMRESDYKYFMTVSSSEEGLDTYLNNEFRTVIPQYSYNNFSMLQDDLFMLEFISDRQAVLTNKQTKESALIKYQKGYLTPSVTREQREESPFYFLEERINDDKIYESDDGYVFQFNISNESMFDDNGADVGELFINIYKDNDYLISSHAQVVNGNTILLKNDLVGLDMKMVWDEKYHFTVQGVCDMYPDLIGTEFYHRDNILY